MLRWCTSGSDSRGFWEDKEGSGGGVSRWHSEFLELVLVVVLLVVLAVVLGSFGLNKKVLVVVLGILDGTRRLWCCSDGVAGGFCVWFCSGLGGGSGCCSGGFGWI